MRLLERVALHPRKAIMGAFCVSYRIAHGTRLSTSIAAMTNPVPVAHSPLRRGSERVVGVETSRQTRRAALVQVPKISVKPAEVSVRDTASVGFRNWTVMPATLAR